MNKLSLMSQLVMVAACSIAVLVAGSLAPDLVVLGDLRFLLLLALLFILTARAIHLRLARSAPPADDAPEAEPPAEHRFDRLLRLLAHPLPLALLLAALLTVRVAAFRIMYYDEGIWNYMAHAWARFQVLPYAGAVENKTPGIFYLFYLSNQFFGVNYWFPRAMGVLATVLTGLGLYAIGARLLNRSVGLLAMLFFGLTSASHVMDGAAIAQTEVFMLACSVLAAYFLLRARDATSLRAHLLMLLLAGASLGAAIAFKQIALLTALGLLLFYRSLNAPQARTAGAVLRDCLVALAGLVAVTALSVLPLLISGVPLADYLQGAWGLLLEPGSMAASPLMRLGRMLRVLQSADLQLYLPVILLVLWQWRRMRAAVPLAGLLGWLLCDLLAANASGHYFGHQLRQALPPLALLAAVAWWTLLHGNTAYEPLHWRHRAVVAVILLCLWWSPPTVYRVDARARAVHETAQWIREHTDEQDYVYSMCTLDINQVLAYAGRRVASRYFNLNFFFNAPAVERQVRRDLAARPPACVIVEQDIQRTLLPGQRIPAWFDTLLARHYRLDKRVTFFMSTAIDDQYPAGYLIYRRTAR